MGGISFATMKTGQTNIHLGLFVYPTFMLNRLKGDKEIKQKEKLILYENIVKVFINPSLPDNWVMVQCKCDDQIYYEDKSIAKMIELLRLRGYIFQKINRRTAINLHLVTAKSNFSKLFMQDGTEYKISNSYKSRVRTALFEVWDD